jgi:hypothetical protein
MQVISLQTKRHPETALQPTELRGRKSLCSNILRVSSMESIFWRLAETRDSCKSNKISDLLDSLLKMRFIQCAANSLFLNILRVTNLESIFCSQVAASVLHKANGINILSYRSKKPTTLVSLYPLVPDSPVHTAAAP